MSNSYKFDQAIARQRIEAQLAEVEAELRQSECDMALLRKRTDGDPMTEALRAVRKKRRDDANIRSDPRLIYKTTFHR